MKYLVVLILLVSLNSFANQNRNNPPVIDAYITVVDEDHLSTIRVNIERSRDTDGKIERSEINFGDGFKSSDKDIVQLMSVQIMFPFIELTRILAP